MALLGMLGLPSPAFVGGSRGSTVLRPAKQGPKAPAGSGWWSLDPHRWRGRTQFDKLVDQVQPPLRVGDPQHRPGAGTGEQLARELSGRGVVQVRGRLVQDEHGLVGPWGTGDPQPGP